MDRTPKAPPVKQHFAVAAKGPQTQTAPKVDLKLNPPQRAPSPAPGLGGTVAPVKGKATVGPTRISGASLQGPDRGKATIARHAFGQASPDQKAPQRPAPAPTSKTQKQDPTLAKKFNQEVGRTPPGQTPTRTR